MPGVERIQFSFMLNSDKDAFIEQLESNFQKRWMYRHILWCILVLLWFSRMPKGVILDFRLNICWICGAQWGHYCIWLRARLLVHPNLLLILSAADVGSGWTRRVMKQFWMGSLRLVSVMLDALKNWCLLILGFRIKGKEFLFIRCLTRWSQGLISCACSISK